MFARLHPTTTGLVIELAFDELRANGWAFSGRRCRRVWTTLTVFPRSAAKIDPILPLRWNAVLGGHAFWIAGVGMCHLRCGRASQRRSATGTDSTHAQHHERSHARGCGWHRFNLHPAPRAVICVRVTTSAAPTQAQHHGRSYARGCGERGPTHAQHHGHSHHARYG